MGRPLKDYVQDLIDVVNPEYKYEFGKLPYSPIQPMYLVGDESELMNDTCWSVKKEFVTVIQKFK